MDLRQSIGQASGFSTSSLYNFQLSNERQAIEQQVEQQVVPLIDIQSSDRREGASAASIGLPLRENSLGFWEKEPAGAQAAASNTMQHNLTASTEATLYHEPSENRTLTDLVIANKILNERRKNPNPIYNIQNKTYAVVTNPPQVQAVDNAANAWNRQMVEQNGLANVQYATAPNPIPVIEQIQSANMHPEPRNAAQCPQQPQMNNQRVFNQQNIQNMKGQAAPMR